MRGDATFAVCKSVNAWNSTADVVEATAVETM
jgi:hypothetical protein